MEGKKQIAFSGADKESVAKLGLPPSDEMVEFINQIGEAAANGGALAQPFLDAGVIRIREQQLIPGILSVRAVGFHNTKFAEVLNAQVSAQHAN